MPMASASMSRPARPPYVCSPSNTTTRLRSSSKVSQSLTASQPPMLTRLSFLALIQAPSVYEQNSSRISAMDRSA